MAKLKLTAFCSEVTSAYYNQSNMLDRQFLLLLPFIGLIFGLFLSNVIKIYGLDLCP